MALRPGNNNNLRKNLFFLLYFPNHFKKEIFIILGNTKGISTIQANKRLNTYPSREHLWGTVSYYGWSLLFF
jgi:hypothetical protein